MSIFKRRALKIGDAIRIREPESPYHRMTGTITTIRMRGMQIGVALDRRGFPLGRVDVLPDAIRRRRFSGSKI